MNQNEYLYNKAIEMEKEGKYLHAIQMYDKLLKVSTFSKMAHVRMAAVYDKLGKTGSSIKLLKNYLELINDSDEEIRIFMGELLIKIGSYSDAIKSIALLAGEKRPETYFLLGLGNYGLKNHSVAKINFEEFVRLNDKAEYTLEAVLYLANIALAQNQLNEALMHIEKVKELGKDNIDIWATAAKIYYYKEMFFHANESIKKALRLKQNDPKLLLWGAKIDFQMGEYKESESKLLEILKIKGNDADAIARLGLVYLKLLRVEDAINCFDKALSIEPNNQIAQINKEKMTTQTQVGN